MVIDLVTQWKVYFLRVHNTGIQQYHIDWFLLNLAHQQWVTSGKRQSKSHTCQSWFSLHTGHDSLYTEWWQNISNIELYKAYRDNKDNGES